MSHVEQLLTVNLTDDLPSNLPTPSKALLNLQDAQESVQATLRSAGLSPSSSLKFAMYHGLDFLNILLIYEHLFNSHETLKSVLTQSRRESGRLTLQWVPKIRTALALDSRVNQILLEFDKQRVLNPNFHSVVWLWEKAHEPINQETRELKQTLNRREKPRS